jgi:hypothetical protein
MYMKHWWSDADTGLQKYVERNLSHCHFYNYKSHVNWPQIKPRPPVTNCLSYLIVIAHSAKKCSCSWFFFHEGLHEVSCVSLLLVVT